jgi:hypothetical protein
MKPVAREAIIIVVCLILGFIISRVVLHYFPTQGKYIDCSISEISPDFTPAMKEACRNRFTNDSKQK